MKFVKHHLQNNLVFFFLNWWKSPLSIYLYYINNIVNIGDIDTRLDNVGIFFLISFILGFFFWCFEISPDTSTHPAIFCLQCSCDMRSLRSSLEVAQAPNTISAHNTNPRNGPMSLNITQGIILVNSCLCPWR